MTTIAPGSGSAAGSNGAEAEASGALAAPHGRATPEHPQYVDPAVPGTHWSIGSLPALASPGSNRVTLAEFDARTSGRFVGTDPPTAEFADGAVHDVRLAPVALDTPAGFSCDVTLSGWERIDYIALGFLQDGTFHHVKRRHLEQGVPLSSTVFTTSLLLRAQGTSWVLTDAPYEFRLYIKGVPRAGGARAELHRCSVWHATPPPPDMRMTAAAAQKSLQAVRGFRDRPDAEDRISADSRHFAATGEVALIPGTRLPWPVLADAPVGPADNDTLRYSWHALNPAARLAEHVGEDGATLRRAAADMAMAWVGSNVYRTPDDPRYAWYDHGSAERLLSLLIVLDRARADSVRSRRMEAVLEWQILEHGRLLASHEFYAANQNTIFHNHAWFQDVALLVASACFEGPEAKRWRDIALERLGRQFDRLVIMDGDVAILSENSIAYHLGVTAMVDTVALLESTTQRAREHEQDLGLASRLVEPLRRWAELLRYAEGHSPSQGDSYRLPPGAKRPIRSRRALESHLFTSAGYGVVHGRDASDPFSLFLFNTGSNPTHKHHDNASITLGMAGVEWLVDPSFYSHDYTATIPAYLRGRWAHNALCISGADYSTTPGLTHLEGTAGPRYTFSASHRAYGGLEVHREIRGSTDRLDVQIDDWVIGRLDEAQDAEICFHLGEHVQLRRTDNPAQVVLWHPGTERAIEMTLPSGDWYTVKGLGSDERTTSLIGHGFQEAVDSVTLHVRVGRTSGTRHRSRIKALSSEPTAPDLAPVPNVAPPA